MAASLMAYLGKDATFIYASVINKTAPRRHPAKVFAMRSTRIK